METSYIRLTVLFDPPFWVGLYERESAAGLEACRVVFGAEPREQEVLEHVLNRFTRLRFSPPTESSLPPGKAANPKRLQRRIHRSLRETGAGTKAQQALKLQQEQLRSERLRCARERKREEKDLRFSLRQVKRKQKHRGH